VLGTGRSNKNDPNDALSVAIAALRSPGLRSVEPANHREVLRLLAKRNHEIGRLRNMVVSRLHAALANLSPGGISKELNASDAVRLLGDFDPITPVQQTRYDLALELLDDVRRLDVQLKESHKRIKTAVKASGTSLTELYGVGPILACELIGYTGDVRRFTTRDQFASYAGVAPIELSSGGRIVHRSTRQPPAQPCRPHGGHLPDPPDGLGRSGLLRAEGGRGQDQAGGHSVPQASRQQRRVPPAPHRHTEVRAREDKRERLVACVTGSAPWRPALRRSHSRTH
jgi:transposase